MNSDVAILVVEYMALEYRLGLVVQGPADIIAPKTFGASLKRELRDLTIVSFVLLL